MNPVAAVSFFVGTAVLAVMAHVAAKRLRRRSLDTGSKTVGSPFAWLLHIPGLILFVPLIMWPLQAFPVGASVPAIVTLAAMLHGCSRVPAGDRQTALVLVVLSTSMWLCYGLYEHQMQQWARTVIAPIRADLIILAPLLYAATVSLFRFWSRAARDTHTRST